VPLTPFALAKAARSWMKTYLTLKSEHEVQLPHEFLKDDVRYTGALVEYFIEQCTEPGDIVFDPFMGFGTTLRVAEAMGRTAYGVELDENRWRYVQSIVKHPDRALLGDSTNLNDLSLPRFHFSMTSPPYMGKNHTENPFTAYSRPGRGYQQYLSDLKEVYLQIKDRMHANGRAVIEVSNLKHEDGSITTLAWDIATQISQVLKFEGEVIVAWDPTYGYGYDHSYCLLFANVP